MVWTVLKRGEWIPSAENFLTDLLFSTQLCYIKHNRQIEDTWREVIHSLKSKILYLLNYLLSFYNEFFSPQLHIKASAPAAP